ncbi:MAG: hypothetical protein GF331_06590 [Chitinivibrionales bacterium]|nr:hypothetical protein [Chitinivibrionales bacterium]
MRMDTIINRLVDRTLLFVAIMAVPLNAVIHFALRQGDYFYPHFVAPLLTCAVYALLFMRGRLRLKVKTWLLIATFVGAGCFTLLLRLIDMASLWFILAMVYTLIISGAKQAFRVFAFALLLSLAAGMLMTGSALWPLDYGFTHCQFACVAVRILHFLVIGYLLYFILANFTAALKERGEELNRKGEKLLQLNRALRHEMDEKRRIQRGIMDAVIRAEEDERRRIASDLHDGLGPVISAAGLHFEAYRDAAEPNAREQIGRTLHRILEEAVADVSRIAHNISPHILEEHGLGEALHAFVARAQRTCPISFSVHIDRHRRFDMRCELALYRAITELVQNAIRHSKADSVMLSVTTEADEILVEYRDSGTGFDIDKAQQSAGMGLRNIRNRIASCDGTIAFRCPPDGGFAVTIRMPVPQQGARNEEAAA